MTPSQIAVAQRLARVWDAAHPREPYCTPLPASGRMGVYTRIVIDKRALEVCRICESRFSG
jgi:hypothetical protein